ncbi:dethiobiotin synthase [Candidatus Nitrososphaera evergladensis SR1]|jgi:dethiobiotin synthetase|uniref:ATP-dependent dethiobiotin synthetase BioD n=1 Tax=Candidatus Nitrososphaera evergladensis SR1 TaxID=1459636 RepID=A0A075MQQ6_9ARCH|nr:dethiobiotin synthase [Candidatus Nitrososphaera evergladensis]AIF83871.1 dethiobiotin synthase [Candidatus Nitrososphaera evergladensis SR1]
MRGVFVTGTDTGIGKTVVAAGIAWLLKKKGIDVAAMKPFATGGKFFSKKFKSEDTAILAAATRAVESDEELNPVFFRVPASPLMAAQILKKSPPDVHGALFPLKKLGIKHQFVVVEGIGGLMVPLTEREFVADFVRLADLPVVVVTHPRLGTLNHTLLTVRVCRDFGLDIRGIIVNLMPKKPSAVERNAPHVMQRLAGVPVLAVLPEMKKPDYKEIGRLLEKTSIAEKILA